jgi:hypothetical protein
VKFSAVNHGCHRSTAEFALLQSWQLLFPKHFSDNVGLMITSGDRGGFPLCLAARLVAVAFMVTGPTAQGFGAGQAEKPSSHTARNVEGWTVQVDDRLLAQTNAELGHRALRLLQHELYGITLVMIPERLADLQKVPIWLDMTHGGLESMQYHPSAAWLTEHGYARELAKCVHIPEAARFASRADHMRQPWAILHELAHAYHDQHLGFDNAEIRQAWQTFVASGRYQSVLQIDGRMEKHYALTDQKEFFAEMTEAYFGQNDFFPFNRAELKREEPQIFELLHRLWGPLPSSITRP